MLLDLLLVVAGLTACQRPWPWPTTLLEVATLWDALTMGLLHVVKWSSPAGDADPLTIGDESVSLFTNIF